MEETPYIRTWETSRRTDDPGCGSGKWRAEWGKVMCCGAGSEGRAGVGVGVVPEDGGRLGGFKKEHIRIVTESKAVVVPDQGWNSTNS